MTRNDPQLFDVEAGDAALTVDLAVGHLRSLRFLQGQAKLEPLHVAPWVGLDEGFPEATPPNVRRLAGDFFCAPFGRNDIEPDAPSHGWTANSSWQPLGVEGDQGALVARFGLSRKVSGAAVEKRLGLRQGHAFLYQEHVFSGGEGAVSVAHHTMTRMSDGGTLSFSSKRFAQSLPSPLEGDPGRGRSIFAYPGFSGDAMRFPIAEGGTADLRRFPVGERHEDFVLLAEDATEGLGWTAIGRHAEGDLVLVLKQAKTLPVTMLWYSHGGRDYAPWSGQHDRVIGIEDGRCHPAGHAASISPNDLTQEGIATSFALAPEGSLAVRQAIGALKIDDPRDPVVSVEAEGCELAISTAGGRRHVMAFDADFLAPAG